MRRPAPLLAGLALAVTLVPLTAPADGECDWPMYGHDAGHSFAQTEECAGIDATNVSTLKAKWFIRTDTPVTASPTIVDGVVYVGDWNGKFRALDSETGREIWSFQVDDTHAVPFGRIVSSAAVDAIDIAGPGDPVRAVLFAGGATLYALDPAGGGLLAKVDVDPRDATLRAAREACAEAGTCGTDEVEIESSPVVGHFGTEPDRIFVGMDVHNGTDDASQAIGRTGLLSFELKKNPGGATPYRFEFKYKFDPETGAVIKPSTGGTLTTGSGTGFGCGGVWSSPALDETALGGDGVIVFGTANCVHNAESAGAQEVGREGVFAISAKGGSLVWKYHPRGANPYDDDFGASPNLLPVTLDGDPIVGEGGKDGTYYAFSRLGDGGSAELKWASHVAQAGHLTDQFAFGGIIGTPAVGSVSSPLGGSEPAVFIAGALSTPIGEPLDSGEFPLDGSLAEDPGRMFSLHAISAVDGRVLWRAPLARQAFGAPTFANGVLFVPSTFDLSVKAFHADTGALLWQHPLNGAPSSSPTIVGDSVYMGTGTTANGLPIELLSGIWAFELSSSTTVPAPGSGILLSAQGNQLDFYDLTSPVPATTRATPIQRHKHDPNAAPGTDATPANGNDVNGQICKITQSGGAVRYLMGEDSDQSQLPNGTAQGWGIFAPTGSPAEAGPWTRVDKIVAPYRLHDNDHLPDNTGCAVSADGSKLFLVDLGIGAFDVPGIGSLFLYHRDANGNFSSSSPVCVLANDLTTAGYIAEHPDGSVLVPESGRSSGGSVSRFRPPFPAAGDSAGCAAYRDAHGIEDRENFLAGLGPFPDFASFVPISIARRNGKWLVGNVVPGQVGEYDDAGNFVRPIVVGQGPGVAGIAVDGLGNLYIANLGLVPCDTILCPQEGAGTLWKVSFDPVTDAALPAVLLMPALTYPEGIASFPNL